MRKITKKFTTVIVILFCMASVYGTKFSLAFFKKNVSGGVISRVKGDENAPIKIVEFIDFQCPACAGGAEYLKEKIKEYPAAIRVEVKHYPLQMHQHGFLSSRYVECATRQGKFWDFQDLLLARQSNWARLFAAKPAFERIADETHLDKKSLKACLADETVDEAIEKDRKEGKALGVRSTPTYFVNGEMAVGKKSLDEAITKLLKENGY